VGEKEDNLEIRLLNLGFLVKEKLFVADGKAPEAAVFLEATTKDGLSFFVALRPDSYLLAREGERVGAYAGRGQQRLVPQEATAAVGEALDYLCGAAFVAPRGYVFFEHDDEAAAPRATTIVFDAAAPLSLVGRSGAEGGARPGAEEDEIAAACAAAIPLVGQEELLNNPEEVRNNVSEAWRRLYELRSERSAGALKRLGDRIRDVEGSFDRLAEAIEDASGALIDAIERLTPAQAQLKAMAVADPQQNTQLAPVESALAVRHQNLRRLHQIAAETAIASDLLDRAQGEIVRLEEALLPMKTLAIQQPPQS
jgi:hypothetical protein